MHTITQPQQNGNGSVQVIPGAQTPEGIRTAAAGGWFDCFVNLTGPAEDGTIFIHLRETGGKFDRWYSATAGMKKEMLATALAALTSGKPVTVDLTTTDEYGVVNRLYVRTT